MSEKLYATAYNQAVSVWNKQKKTTRFLRPRKGSPEYNEIKAIEADIKSGKIKAMVKGKAPRKKKAAAAPAAAVPIEEPLPPPVEVPATETPKAAAPSVPIPEATIPWSVLRKKIEDHNRQVAADVHKILFG